MGLGGGCKSNAKGAKLKGLQALTVYGVGWAMGRVSPFYWGGIFFIFGCRNAYFGAFTRPSEYLLLHCNNTRSRPQVRLFSLTFQADCGSVNGAGVPTEEGNAMNIIFPGGEYTTNLIIANVETL